MEGIMKPGPTLVWASLFGPFMDTNVYGTGSIKIWKLATK